MDWQPTLELRRYDDTPKLTNVRLQQRWKRYRLSDCSLEYEWRDVPLVWDREKARQDDPRNLNGTCEDPRLRAAGYQVCGSNADKEWHWRHRRGRWHDGYCSEAAAVNAALREIASSAPPAPIKD